MKVTIYELLGMIKDGKTPKKIKYDGKLYEFNDKQDNYYENETCSINWDYVSLHCLNEEVEILEEEKKIPEKLEEPRFNKGRYYIKDINGDDSEISGIERTFRLKINEIIDYLKSKGE